MPRKWRAQKSNKRLRPEHNDDGRDTAEKYKNELFEKYYKEQNIVPEGEWDDFMSTLLTPLPSAFRITKSPNFEGHDQELLQKIKGDYLKNLMNVEIDGKVLENPIKCLPWYPNELAWQFEMDRRTIRKNADLSKLHTFLVQEAESGSISRQESVSMIPPLVMDVQPHHKVLDMCAAPGSKTSQLVEAIHSDGSSVPDGIVIANDVDNKRCYLLHHEVKRLASPSLMVVNHDATMMPNLRISHPDEPNEWLNYDRVLCDVPCSGDGTLRKNGDIWGKWATPTGFGLHGVQIRILKRGIEALDVGGRLVYSTCSMNPIENEAVLSTLLTRCKGSMELVDVSSELPGLKKMPGLLTWKVMDKKGAIYNNHEEVPANLAKNQIRESMFPPSKEIAEEQHLERCIRVLPHHQNTGGFFVAVLKKTSRLYWHDFHDTKEKNDEQKTSENSRDEGLNNTPTDADNESSKRKLESDKFSTKQHNKKRKMQGHTEDPFIYLTENESIWPPLKEYFGISDNFPVTQLLARSLDNDTRRKLYFTNNCISKIVQYNIDRLKIINVGVRTFERTNSQYTSSQFRFAQDGMKIIEPCMSKRKVHLEMSDIVTMCSEENPFMKKMSSSTLEQLLAFKDQGPLTYVYEPKAGVAGPDCRIVLGGWLGKTSCRTFLAMNERAHFLRLCGSELKPKKAKQNPTQSSASRTIKENEENKIEIKATDNQEQVEELQMNKSTTDTKKCEEDLSNDQPHDLNGSSEAPKDLETVK